MAPPAQFPGASKPPLLPALVLVAVGLVGCATPTVAGDGVPAQVLTPISIASVAPRTAPAQSDGPVGNETCVVTDHDVDIPVPLRLRADGPTIATLQQAPAVALALDAGTQSDPFVEASGGGIGLRAPWDPKRLPLHLRRPVALGGVVTPLAHRTVTWLSSHTSTATIRYQGGPAFEPFSIDADVDCGLLALQEAKYEAQDAGPAAPVASEEYLEPGVDIDVFAQPGGPSVVRLKLRFMNSKPVTIHGRQGHLVNVRYETEDEVLMGWIASTALAAEPPAMLGLTGAGAGGGFAQSYRAKSPMHWMQCDRDVAIHAQAGAERGWVGNLTKGGRFEAGARHDGWVEVDFWVPWIVPQDGVFVVTEEDFAHCGATRAP